MFKRIARGRSVAAHADHGVRNRPSRGSRSRIRATSARRSSIAAWCIRRTCAPKSRSIPPTTKSRSAISARSTSSTTSRLTGSTTTSWRRTVATAMRMLDNVIDVNFYTIPEARRSNLRHRPIGLGLMGFQDALQIQRIAGGIRPTPSLSPTKAWRRSAIMPFRRHPTSPPSAASIRPMTARCGAVAFCRSIRSTWSASHAAPSTSTPSSTLDWDDVARSASPPKACAIPTPWRSRRPRPSPTSAACRSRSSRPIRTSTSNRTCRATSRS